VGTESDKKLNILTESVTISFAFQLAFVPRGALERTALDDVLSLCKSVRYPSDRHSAEGWYHVGWPNDPRHEIDGKLVTVRLYSNGPKLTV